MIRAQAFQPGRDGLAVDQPAGRDVRLGLRDLLRFPGKAGAPLLLDLKVATGGAVLPEGSRIAWQVGDASGEAALPAAGPMAVVPAALALRAPETAEPRLGEVGLSLDISRGTDSLARHDSLWSASGSQQIHLSFEAVVGDELVLTLSAHQQLTQGLPALLDAGQRLDIDRSGLLQGQLTVAAVPEPQSLAMLLGGLAVLGGVLRRRAQGL